MHNQEKGPVTLLYIILTPDHVGIKQTRLTPVYISSHMTLYLWAWEWNQSPALNRPSQSVSPNVTLFLLKSFTLKLMHTVWLPGWTEKIGEAIVKVMWCHESRFTLFLGDEHTVPWREVDKSDAATIIVIIPVPALQACGSSVMILSTGCFFRFIFSLFFEVCRWWWWWLFAMILCAALSSWSVESLTCPTSALATIEPLSWSLVPLTTLPA